MIFLLSLLVLVKHSLSSSKQSVAGFSTNNAIILINGVFQGPQGTQAETEDYDLTESAGITSITFSGMGATVGYDVNTSSVPVGGVIVSVGSTEGFGLQPLISAGGTDTPDYICCRNNSIILIRYWYTGRSGL